MQNLGYIQVDKQSNREYLTDWATIIAKNLRYLRITKLSVRPYL